METDNIRITQPETDLDDICQRHSLEEDDDDIEADQDEEDNQELSSPELEERAIPIR